MAAVVRIKRRLDEDPLESLVLNCKRKKSNGSKQSEEHEDLSAVLKLAGTSQKEENIEALLRKHRVGDAAELKEQFKKHPVNISDKIRADLKESSKNNRYKIVNCFRKTLNSEDNEPQASCSSASEVTVFDVETDHNSNEPATVNQEPSMKYVYDFYYTNSDDFGEADIAEYVSVYPVNDPLVFGSIRDNGLLDNDSDDESEDSNAENYWKNDYPDEEDLESVNEDDMIEAVKNLKMDEDLLSSDSDAENLIYSREEEDFQQANIDKEDELRFGQKYAVFKSKNKNVETTGLANDFYCGDIDEEEYYY
ncbi:unnamed protein product [Ceutorhynchus assimilis]|uniref:Probable RNA polymerase II nuclear localization protein SLC7A6OS n=1 Tax=Ceutorhynchus assimilis TaxID=467358 RepID=A0A9N9QKH5_9CUCU|nr:unnamed protein product [Ceutorhynchus assimilis]